MENKKNYLILLSFTTQDKKLLVCFLTIPNKYLQLDIEHFKEKESKYYDLSKLFKGYNEHMQK